MRSVVLVVLAASVVAGGALAGEIGMELKPVRRELALEVEIGEFGPVTVAYAEHTGGFHLMAEAIPSFFGELGKQGIEPVGPLMGIYPDDPRRVPEEKLRWEVAIPVPEGAEPADPLKQKVIAKCTVARTEYKGPANKMGQVYEPLIGKALKRGYIPVGPAMEIYPKEPEDGMIECTIMFVVREAPPMEVEFVAFGPRTVAYVAHTGSYDQMPGAITKLFAALKAQRIRPEGPLMGIYHNDPDMTPEEQLRWEVAVPVSDDAEPGEPLELKVIAECTVARTTYSGPIEGIGDTYKALVAHALKDGYTPIGPAIEIFGKPPKDGEIECTLMFVVRKMPRIHRPELIHKQ